MSASFIQANTNGRLHDAREPSISPLNRGFLYGDAIYEVWRTYHGVLFAWEEHWRRLERSAAALHLTLPFAPAQALVEIKRTVAAFFAATGAQPEVYVRLQITRGGGAIGLDPALADRPDFTLLVQPNPAWTPRQLAGLQLSLATGLRRNPVAALSPAWKTGNYLNNILCLREARARGADEVVIINLAGEVTEAAVSNIAFVRAGGVVTPPMEAGILGGITRPPPACPSARPRCGRRISPAWTNVSCFQAPRMSPRSPPSTARASRPATTRSRCGSSVPLRITPAPMPGPILNCAWLEQPAAD